MDITQRTAAASENGTEEQGISFIRHCFLTPLSWKKNSRKTNYKL